MSQVDKQTAIGALVEYRYPSLTKGIQADITSIHSALGGNGPFSQTEVIVRLWQKRAKELSAMLPDAVVKHGTEEYSDTDIVSIAFDDWTLSRRESHALSMLIFEAYAYRAELGKMTADCFHKLYRKHYDSFRPRALNAALMVDKERFFSFPEAEANFARWLTFPSWEVEEAVALSLGKDPIKVSNETLEPIRSAGWSPFCEEYAYRSKLILRAVISGDLTEPLRAVDFISWCHKSEVGLPQELVSASKAEISDNAQLRAENEKLRNQLATYTETVDEMKAKSRSSLFNMLLVMAC